MAGRWETWRPRFKSVVCVPSACRRCMGYKICQTWQASRWRSRVHHNRNVARAGKCAVRGSQSQHIAAGTGEAGRGAERICSRKRDRTWPAHFCPAHHQRAPQRQSVVRRRPRQSRHIRQGDRLIRARTRERWPVGWWRIGWWRIGWWRIGWWRIGWRRIGWRRHREHRER